MKIEEKSSIEIFKENLKSLPTRFGPARAAVGAFEDFDGNPYPGKGVNGFTSKDKAVLGIPEMDKTIWVPFILDGNDRELIRVAMEELKMDEEKVLSNILLKWLADNREFLEELAGDYIKENNSEDEIAKKMAAAEALMKKYQKQLAQLKNQ